MSDPVDILPNSTLAILAGGAGSRMGKPKALLQIKGEPILTHLLNQFQWPGPTLLITAPGREHPPGHEMFTREAIDPTPDEGPLRGILTALEAADTPLVAVSTVDMPEIRREHLAWLVEQLIAVPNAWGLACMRLDGLVEPFPCALRKSATDRIRGYFATGARAVHTLVSQPGFSVIHQPSNWPQSTWTNLNRPEDLKTWLESQ